MKVAILGYGKLGHGAALAVRAAEDMELVGIYTERDPKTVTSPYAPVFSASELLGQGAEIDILIIAHGSQDALRTDTPRYARRYCSIDSFDIHAELWDHLLRVDAAGRESGTVSLVGAGWDPGLLSLMRIFGQSILPEGRTNTLWGRGVSQGHSLALKTIPDVEYAVEYTVPKPDAKILADAGVLLSDTERHKRVCYLVAKESAHDRIEREIRSMPGYFEGYDCEIHFITKEAFEKEHRCVPHRGEVVTVGMSGAYLENRETMRFTVELDSNPEFTGAILSSCARALYRLKREGARGAITMADIPPSYYLSEQTLRALL